MSQTDTRPGFRLPWTAERSDAEQPTDATSNATSAESAADAVDATVIVVGSRGRSTLAASVLGSVSTGILHHTKRPVLVVR